MAYADRVWTYDYCVFWWPLGDMAYTSLTTRDKLAFTLLSTNAIDILGNPKSTSAVEGVWPDHKGE